VHGPSHLGRVVGASGRCAMLKIPKPIRNAPENGCYVCRGEVGFSRCSGGCGLCLHAACEGLPPAKGKRKRKDVVAEATASPTAGGESQASTSDFSWTCGRCKVIVGAQVFARLGNDTFFWPARVQARDQHDRVCVEWEDGPPTDGAPDSSTSSPRTQDDGGSSGGGGADGGGEGSRGGTARSGSVTGTWLEERHACMRDAPAAATDLKRGSRAVCIWIDGHGYACEVLGSAGRRQMAVQFEDGLQYDAPLERMRTLLDEPLSARAHQTDARLRTPHAAPFRALSERECRWRAACPTPTACCCALCCWGTGHACGVRSYAASRVG
jgi:hypothetical protein